MKGSAVRRSGEPPIDRGWAWMVLLAASSWNFIFGGIMKSYGLLYLEFIDVLQSSPAKTGLIGLAFGITTMLISPISGMISDNYSTRMMAISGGVMASVGLIIAGYASNIWVAVVGFGVLFGGAVGFIDGPLLAAQGKFFKKRRALASGITFSGSSFGSLVMAPTTSFLIAEYSIRGALLILAGIMLNVCVLGALIRPFNDYKVPFAADGVGNGENESSENDSKKNTKHMPTSNCSIEVRISTCENDNSDNNSELENKMDGPKTNGDGTERRDPETKLVQSKSESTQLSKTLQSETLEADRSGENIMLGAHVQNPIVAALKVESKMYHRAPLASSLPNGLHVQHIKQDEGRTVDNKARSMFGSNLSITNLLYRGDSMYDLNKAVSRTAVQEKNKDISDVTDEKNQNSYVQLLLNPFLIRDVFVIGLGCYAYYTPIVTLPAYGVELGIGKFEIAWTVGIIGMVEVPSRLCLSWMTDRFKLRPASVLTVSFFITGVCGQSFVFAPSHTTMIAYACVHGVFGGFSLIMMCPLFAESVGVGQLGSAVGLAVMQANLAVSVSSTTAGAMKQLTGSYGSTFRVSSAIYLLATCIYCLTPRGFFKAPYKYCRPTAPSKQSGV